MRQVKIKVPTTLNDIKLSQYQKFLRVTDGVEDETLISNYMVEIFCNLPTSVVRNMSAKSFRETYAQITSIFNYDTVPFAPRFIMNDIEYGFIPNLDDITVGEQVDADTFIKDWQKMDKAMSVLYRPVTGKHKDKYKIEDYKEAYSLDVPLDIALGSYFFLQNLFSGLVSCIPNFIEAEAKTNPKLRSLLENGDGISSFMESLKEMFLNMNKLSA